MYKNGGIKMKLSKEICKLIAELEYLVGSECYNPNSYDGWNDIEGCDFRYPINVPTPGEDGEYIKIKGRILNNFKIKDEDVSESMVSYMKYKFGSNELYIGQGIMGILEYLERRYKLDFNELEENVK